MTREVGHIARAAGDGRRQTPDVVLFLFRDDALSYPLQLAAG